MQHILLMKREDIFEAEGDFLGYEDCGYTKLTEVHFSVDEDHKFKVIYIPDSRVEMKFCNQCERCGSLVNHWSEKWVACMREGMPFTLM